MAGDISVEIALDTFKKYLSDYYHKLFGEEPTKDDEEEIIPPKTAEMLLTLKRPNERDHYDEVVRRILGKKKPDECYKLLKPGEVPNCIGCDCIFLPSACEHTQICHHCDEDEKAKR